MTRTAPDSPGHPDLALLGIVAAAALLRLPGLATDFWLDEIWTLEMIEQRTNDVLDIFTSIRHSNNHHLNTLIFYLLGEQEHWAVYRIHSLVAGVASVWLAFRIGARAGRVEATIAAGLCATSYLLIHFSSEGRGYAMVVAFSLAAFDVLQRAREGEAGARATQAIWFAVFCCLGFLSHLMFLHTFVAAFVWFAVAELRRAKLGAAVARLGALFGPTAVFLLWFYFLDIRDTKIGDGPETSLSGVFVKALSYAFGGPPDGRLAVVVAITTATVWLGSIAWLARRGRDTWIFYLVVIVVSPAASFALLRPDLFFARYFLLGTTFGLIAAAYPLAAAWRARGRARGAASIAIALVLIGNASLTARFYQYGRGDYLGTMRFIAESTPDVVLTVAGDHRFRTRNVIHFYNRFLPPHQRLILVDQRQYPEWLLLHRIGALGTVDEALADRHGHKYELARTARYADLSGWHWLAYRRVR